MRRFGEIRHLVRLVCVVLTILLAMVLIFSAYGGRTHPSQGTIYPLATLALPIVLVVSMTAALAWIVVGRWKVSLILFAALLLSWPTVRTVCPLNVTNQPDLRQTVKRAAVRDTLGFKVLTFNVRNFNVEQVGDDNVHNTRGQATWRYILDQDADVVLLQEASLNADFNDLRLLQPYYQEMVKKYPYREHGYHDQVILSKHPYTRVEDPAIRDGFGAPDDVLNSYHFYARAFDVLVPGHTVRFINVHLQSIGLSHEDRQVYEDLTRGHAEAQRDELREVRYSLVGKLRAAFLNRAHQADIIRQVIDQSDENVIVCGDFNDTPASWAFNTIMGSDMRDAWTECGFGMTYTFNDNRLYFMIDHIMYKGDMQCTSVRRDRAGSSDHYPLVATFNWKR